ncbi:MAG: sigma-54-dependent Fis family transcriptional regulator [Phycisphaerales bacterium]|nr:sigma-54-dependent Fis family transcriptional regulator [Phycisphaerales bacterium]
MATSSSARILIVDDDPIVAESLAEFISAEGHRATTALNGIEALAALAKAQTEVPAGGSPFNIVISDISMPGMDGLALLKEIAAKYRGIVAIMLTGYGTIEAAVSALKQGATDFLTKPVVDDELRVALERAIKQQALLAENQLLRRRLDGKLSLDNIIGADHRMQRIFELVEAVAPSRTTVLMTGESGTGKSLIAHAIHHRSPRASKPYVELSCGSIPETLLESELFGHVKGAFTGAHTDKVGRFLAADKGTIFLDEINSASPGMQLKLLRVLQERKFEPVGSTQTIEVDVRVVLASNQPLEQLVAAGQFRQDLYYRINVVKIELPPLRERVGDIPVLAESFLAKHSTELGKQIIGFTPEAMDAMRRYTYPGNVRELQNIIERAAVLTRGQTITIDDLPPQLMGGTSGNPGRMAGLASAITGALNSAGFSPADDDTAWVPMPLEEALRGPEKLVLLRALRANDWNRQKTADQLNINRTTLYKKMKQHGIDSRIDAIPNPSGSPGRMAG